MQKWAGKGKKKTAELKKKKKKKRYSFSLRKSTWRDYSKWER